LPGVRDVTRLPDDSADARPNDAAQHASSALAALRVQAVDATPVLRALSDAGRQVRRLTVAEASLEDVFLP
jgi:hypothetical protein